MHQMTHEIHIHLHFHPGDGDVPKPLFNELKRILAMNHEEVVAALDAANAQLTATTAKLDETNNRFDKGINEVLIAISNAGNVPQSVIDAVTRLQNSVTAAGAEVDESAGKAGTLDDIVPDSTP